MPRGIRKQPMGLEEQIAEATEQIKQLQEKKKKLLAEQEQRDMKLLLEAAKESGLTPGELVARLKAINKTGTPAQES